MSRMALPLSEGSSRHAKAADRDTVLEGIRIVNCQRVGSHQQELEWGLVSWIAEGAGP